MQEAVEGFRLSPTQRRLWSLHEGDGGEPYAAWLALEIRGPLDVARLEEALGAVFRRHEILRTTFLCPESASVAVQVIREEPSLAWEDADDAPSGILDTPPARRPMSFAEGPLVTVRRTVLAEERQRLELFLPSLIADVETLARLAGEIAETYVNRSEERSGDGNGGGDGGEDEGLQYADIAEWLNGFVGQETAEDGAEGGGAEGGDGANDDTEEGRRHWRRLDLPRRLAAVPLLGEERTPAGKVPFASRGITAQIDAVLRGRLEELAERHGADLERLLLACYLVLLERSAADGEIVVAAAFDGRGFEELEGALGPLTRFLPVVHPGSEGARLKEILEPLGRELEAAAEWLEVFTWEEHAPAAGPARPPFGFEYLEEPAGLAAGATRFTVEDLAVTLEPFTLHLVAEARQDASLRLRFLADAGRLSEAATGRLMERFRTLLEGLAASPETPWDRFPLLGEDERRTLLDPERAAPPEGTVDTDTDTDRPLFELIDEQARRTPDRIALADARRELTYAELRRRSNALALRLQDLGVGPEARVAICLERSVEVIVSMLAVHKAGGAYVPVDPAFPEDRLAFLLEDARAAVLLTTREVVKERFGETAPSGRTVLVDELLAEEAEEAPAAGITSENLAYLIYTSGSTGVPKGTAIGHRQITRYALGAAARLDLPGEGRYALVSTFGADLGNTMIFPALCRGGTLHVVAEECVRDPEAWQDLLKHRPIDVLKIVPSHLRMLLEGSHPEVALPRQRLVLGGEACPWELVERIFELVPDCRIFNHYGPTETTVGILAQELLRDGPRPATPPLGPPLPGNRVHLLDEDLEPVLLGTPGEAFLAGVHLSRGYLGRPAQTAERFLPDPWSGEAGARMYRSGDLLKCHPDGFLFQGRVDDQVKIHGFRIEPREVESALAELAEVGEVVVLPRLDPPDRHRLVAYVVPAAGGDGETVELRGAELRHRLLEKLPAYLVPASFVVLDKLPLNPNGKIDRQALPAPEEVEHQVGRRAPKDPAEVQLLQIWEDVLGVHPIGVSDNFFELGGDSFLAVRLMARIQSHFERRFPLTALISAGTVRELAERLREGESASPEHLVAIQPRGSKPPLFCAHPGHGGVICYLELAHHLGTDQPVYGFQSLDFDLDRDPHTSLEAMASRYVDNLLEARPEGPYLLAGWSFGGLVAYEMAQELHGRGREVELLVLFDCRLPMTAKMLTDLEPSLLRATLLFDHVTDRPEDGAVSPYDLQGLSLAEQLEVISKKLGARPEDLAPEEFGPELVERYVEMRMARIDALREHTFRPYPGRIVLFRATEPTPRVPLEEMRRAFDEAERSADYGWSELSPRVEVIEVPGTHGSMIDAPHIEELSGRLREILDGVAGAEDLSGSGAAA